MFSDFSSTLTSISVNITRLTRDFIHYGGILNLKIHSILVLCLKIVKYLAFQMRN